MEENNKKPSFKIDTDSEGRTYYKGYANCPSSCVVALDEKNICLTGGNPSLIYRKGKSVFKDQLLFNFFLFGDCIKTVQNMKTKNESVEIYLSINDGLNFLKKFIKWIEPKVNDIEALEKWTKKKDNG